VKLGSRVANNEKLAEWLKKNKGKIVSTGTFADAAQFGELIVVATNWNGTENALKLAGPDNFAGKIVIDATNPLRFEPNKPPQLAVGWTDSAGEQVQRWLPSARVVKAFNSVGNPHMINPAFPGGPPDMFICGNNNSAKTKVTEILNLFGWAAIDMGSIECARYIEPLAMIWIMYYMATGSGNHAFKLLKK
jgi:predicted dinucleotide-binding enzyme